MIAVPHYHDQENKRAISKYHLSILREGAKFMTKFMTKFILGRKRGRGLFSSKKGGRSSLILVAINFISWLQKYQGIKSKDILKSRRLRKYEYKTWICKKIFLLSVKI